MSEVRIARRAERDIAKITDYLDEHAVAGTAERFVDELTLRQAAYARQPMMGDLREDLDEGLRSFLVLRNYVVIYQPIDDGIEILRIFHAARNHSRYLKGES